MKLTTVKLPIWKAYLYSLIRRYRRFLWINKGMLEFGMSKKETGTLHNMVHKYLRKEVLRQVKSVQYYHLVSIVLGSKLSIATKQEINVANKLFIAYHINTRSLIMELKQIKAFAKEVGISAAAMKKLDEDELILEIVKSLDPEATYSDKFIEWYEELPDELFDEADAIDEPKKGKKSKTIDDDEEEEEADFSDLIEAIEEAGDIEELVEIAEDDDFAEIFAEVDTDVKAIKKLKKAMLAAIEVFQEEAEEETEEVEIEEPVVTSKKGRKAKEEPVEEEEVEESDMQEVIDAIEEAESAEELKEIADEVKEDDAELFKGISFRSGRGKSPYREDVDVIKAEMLERLGVVEKDDEAEEEEEELEITAELVNDALEADDKEALNEMCNELNIALRILEKKSAKKMADRILEKLPKEAKKTEKRNVKSKVEKEKELVEEVEDAGEESQSLFQLIEEMVENGDSEKEITKAVSPILEARGKKKLFITKFIKQIIAVVQSVQ